MQDICEICKQNPGRTLANGGVLCSDCAAAFAAAAPAPKRIRFTIDLEVPDAWEPGAVWHLIEDPLALLLEPQGMKILAGASWVAVS